MKDTRRAIQLLNGINSEEASCSGNVMGGGGERGRDGSKGSGSEALRKLLELPPLDSRKRPFLV